MKYALSILLVIVLVCVGVSIWFVRPYLVGCVNTKNAQVYEVDSATNWNTLHEVEDSCRAMIASYNTDVLYYNQYSSSTNPEHQSWAQQARMRANQTAATYNEYILKNNFVWPNGIPWDIKSELPYI